jgi:hypothetical protein
VYARLPDRNGSQNPNNGEQQQSNNENNQPNPGTHRRCQVKQGNILLADRLLADSLQAKGFCSVEQQGKSHDGQHMRHEPPRRGKGCRALQGSLIRKGPESRIKADRLPGTQFFCWPGTSHQRSRLLRPSLVHAAAY